MILLNFSHPLTMEHFAQIETLTRQKIEQAVDIKVQFNNDQPFQPQLQELMTKIQLTSKEWQTKPILVNLPSLNTIATLLLAELHGRMGYFPPALRIRPVANSMPTRYEVAEILNLQNMRDGARQKRTA